MADPRRLTILQAKTFRAVFRMLDASGNPVSLTGWNALFEILSRPDGAVVWSADQTSPALLIEPAGATGEIHLRLGADVTAALNDDGVYDLHITSQGDPTEVQPVMSGPISVVPTGAEA